MQWVRGHWKAIVVSTVLFLVGIGLGAAGGTSAESADTVTVREANTISETTTVEADPATVTETVTKVKRVVKPPPSSGVKVDYGEWEGLFKIHGARVKSSFGTPSVIGQFEYLGGGDCDLGYVEVSGTFFNRSGKIVGTGLWNTETAPKGARLPMEVLGEGSGATRAEIVVTSASCK